jgi:hypothetical protein
MLAIWILAGAILFLACVILAVARHVARLVPPALTEDEIREHIAPCVAAELIIMQAEQEEDDSVR